MPDLPSSLALTTIADDAEIVASAHRNNYSAIQTGVNGLITALSGGTAGQLLAATDTDTVAWQTVPAARVYNSADISIANQSAIALTFDSERFDTDTMHSTSANTGRLTATSAGVYMISATVSWAASNTGYRMVQIRLNGSTIIASNEAPNNAASNAVTLTVSTLYKLAAADYVEVLAYQSSGGALNVVAAGNYSPEFSMVKVAVG